MGSQETAHTGCTYEIRFRGYLDERHARWFEGLSMTRLPQGETLLQGYLPDQPALYGVLNRIRDLGLQLIEIKEVSSAG